MKYLIFIILIAALVFTYLYFESKLALAKKQLLIASKQHSNQRSKNLYRQSSNSTFSVKFQYPSSKIGIVNSNSLLYLGPSFDSSILRKIEIKMEVQILDSAICNNKTWYYVNLPVDEDVNCRGWIKASDFSVFYSDNLNITRNVKQ